MKYCVRCLYPSNHPLNIHFDEHGLCSGCRVHEEKDNLDWKIRERKLADLFTRYRNKSQSNYDCVVPVSGARDSFFIVHTLKNVYGMNPLLVTYNKHYNSLEGIQNLRYLRTVFDCDIITLTLDPRLVKEITRYTIANLGSIYWHCLAGQTVFPVRVAVGYKIPLIVWGVHQGIDQVGMYSHLDEVEMTRKYRKEHDLMGLEAEDLVDKSIALTEKKLSPLFYPHDKEIEAVGVRGIYLGNFLRWDSKKQHENMLQKFNYITAPLQRTFDAYNDVDCLHYSGLHDYIKFIKHGYGKISDHVSREIRLGRISRSDGIEIVKKYRDIKPFDLDLFLKWIDLSENDFFACIDQFRSKEAWLKSGAGWQLGTCVTHDTRNSNTHIVANNDKCIFKITQNKTIGHSSNGGFAYQMLSKGHCKLKDYSYSE
jgi:N-acetyl sugar amidotransferase